MSGEAFLEGEARQLREQLRRVERQLAEIRRRKRPEHFGKLSATQPLLWRYKSGHHRARNRHYGDWLA